MLILFVSGLCVGFFAGRYHERVRMHQLMQRGPERLEEMILHRLSEQLHLDPGQQQAVRERVALMTREAECQMRERGEVMRKRMTRLLEEIRPGLTPSQREILDRMDADDLRPGPPPPPPDMRPRPPHSPPGDWMPGGPGR